eukprot:3783-Chlamydomonas_euryale.AAC.2
MAASLAPPGASVTANSTDNVAINDSTDDIPAADAGSAGGSGTAPAADAGRPAGDSGGIATDNAPATDAGSAGDDGGGNATGSATEADAGSGGGGRGKAASGSAARPGADTYHAGYAWAQVVEPQQGGKSVDEVWAEYQPHAKHDALVAASPDVFEGLPEFFSSRTKNPCWFENRTLRCIPYYHILGVSKCGTTDIYNRLVMHPHVYESNNKVDAGMCGRWSGGG